MEAHEPGAGVFCAEAVFGQAIPDFARGAVLGDLFKEIVVRVEEETQPRAELVDVEAAAAGPLHVLDAVIDGEGQFLQGRGSGFADVVTADGNGVEARGELGAELEGVNHQAHARRRGIDVLLLRDVLLENVVLDGAGNLLPVGALFFRHHQVHGPEHAGGGVDGHRDGGLFEIDAVEQDFHVLQRVDSDAALAHLAFAGRMIGIVAHQRGQIECNRETAAAMLEQVLVALVRFLGRCEPREHAHGPELAAVAGGVNAARERRFAGEAQILLGAPVLRKVGCRVEAPHRDIGDGAEAGVAVLVEVGAGGGTDRLLGSFFESGGQGFLSPLLFPGRGVASLEDIRNRALGNLRLGIWLLAGHAPPRPASLR